MSEVLQIFAHDDPMQGKKPPLRVAESESWGNVDANRLMGLLDEMDDLKHEIQDRMRRMEAVKQAKSLLLEDALKTEALNRKLAELSRAVGGSPAALRIAEAPTAEPDLTHPLHAHDFRHPSFEARPRVIEPRIASDSLSFPRRGPEETLEPSLELGGPADQHERTAVEPEKPTLNLADPDLPTPEPESVSLRLEQAEHSWRQAEEANLEARQCLERSVAELAEARSREEAATSDLHTARLEAAKGYETAAQRMEEAEWGWKQAEHANAEAKRLIEQSIAELQKTRKEEEDATADLHKVRAELLAASASVASVLDQLSMAEQCWKQADAAGLESKKAMEHAVAELVRAQAKEETATSELNSARQELTTAYQFAAVAAQRRLEATEFFRKASRWAIFSASLSWAASAWFGWFAMRTFVPIWAPGVATGIIVLVASLLGKAGTKEA